MIVKTDSETFLYRLNVPIIDVRSPAEFAQGHIPGAFNVPLFDDNERAEIGILYKKAGKLAAILRGLDIVGPKMSGFIKEGLTISHEQKIRIHCWRGGMRSDSMAWLFSTAGFEVNLLTGGYKAYRTFIREKFESEAKYVVLSGKTGSGKTEILHELKKSGQQILDLEGIAHHKGSSFGAIGEIPQPTTEQFENLLFEELKKLDLSKTIWLEDESKCIGRVSIPEPLFSKMRTCSVIRIDMPVKLRVHRLVKDYAGYPKGELVDAIHRITRKLGGQHANTAIEAIQNNDFETAIEIVLFYYDKTYSFGLEKRVPEKTHTIIVETEDAEKNAANVIDFIKNTEAI